VDDKVKPTGVNWFGQKVVTQDLGPDVQFLDRAWADQRRDTVPVAQQLAAKPATYKTGRAGYQNFHR
jgi:hypothetical protein